LKETANKRKDTKLKDYMQLTKPSLSTMVVFSSVISYLLAPKVSNTEWSLTYVVLLFIGGFLVTGSANAINQTVEKETDGLMKRTATRPIAAGRMSVTEGWVFAIVTGVAGVAMLTYFFNLLSGLLALFSLFLYAFVYTPLKKVNAIAVLVGAVPGALPCLIGWAAGNDAVFEAGNGWKDWGGWVLFGIQFLWQFPHFWAIAWVAHKDYSGAGFRLLPAEKGPTKFTAIQTVMYAVLLIPVCVLPYVIQLTGYQTIKGKICIAIIMLANLFLVAQCVRLYNEMNATAARRVMFSSYIYLPVILLALLASKV
jgi:protoheme IX farnesyltransferase